MIANCRVGMVRTLISLAMVFSSSWSAAQGPVRAKSNEATTSNAGHSVLSSLSGKWTYRSFISDPNLNTEPNNLLFGSGTMELSATAPDNLSGTLGGPDWQLTLSGKVMVGTPVSIRFTGTGIIGGEEWVYDYLGFAVPSWPNGVDQRPAIVGTIVRTKAHSGGTAKAGVVAQWIAVAQQQTTPGSTSSAGGRAPMNWERTFGPMDSLRQPRSELPSERLLRQKYLQENPLNESRVNALPFSATKPLADSELPARLRTRPLELKSSGGRLDVTLDVDYGTAMIGKDQVRLRMYNQRLIGPTLRVTAGDDLYITLNNRLPLEPSMPHEVNGHHEWNTTNLHFHGLHVAPQGPQGVPDAESDNVLLELPPSNPFDPAVSTKKYKVKIPANHVAGTFWYHAHRHGSTTAQVSSGMAGALIVERLDAVHNLNSVPEIAAAQEEIMVLQEIPYLRDSPTLPGAIERSPPSSSDPNENDVRMFAPGSFRDLRRYVTVNGDKIPTIAMAPGEIRRLRLVYTGQRERVRLRVERAPNITTGPEFLTLHEIAVDGLPTGSIRAIDPTQPEPRDRVLEMFSGYRSEVLLQSPSAAGDYYLVDIENDVAGPRPETGADGSPELLRWVAKIHVEGTPLSMAMPTSASLAPYRLADLSPSAVSGTQHAFYGLELALSPIGYFISRQDLSASASPVSTLNAEAYNPVHPRILPLGATERWLVGSRNNGAAVTHPFHIHTNPYLIAKVTSLVEPSNPGVPQDVTAREIGTPTWRDTLAMRHGYTYELLTRYDDFSGDFVDHCHILDHEDNGMMELVRIESPSPVSPSLPSAENKISRVIPPANGDPSVVFFVKGSGCPHCMSQLIGLSAKLASRKAQVAVVSASTEADLQNFPALPFVLVADPELKLFKENGVYEGEPRHATIVRDGAGKEVLRKVGSEPFRDADVIARALGRTAADLAIAVRGTDEVADDYLTWSPTTCTIRTINGIPGSGPVTVTLTNESPSANPAAGELRFATSLTPGTTATLKSITLDVNPDGSPVTFFVAGVKPSSLTADSLLSGGRDTKIVIHQGNETGPQLGEHYVMVRIRKNYATLNALEKKEFLKAMASLRDMQDPANDRFEPLVRMHKLAAMERMQGFDQAHLSSGFLPWHRAFLLVLEREMQTKYPHVALPYWLMDQPPAHFTLDDLGNNYDPQTQTTQDEVLFAPSNPLYGWRIRFDNMGRLVRAPGDHVQISNGSHYRSSASLNSSSQGKYGQFHPRLEDDPHNIGHNNTGAWMGSCVTSPGDPLFWIFHCHHDHLWGQWQREFGKFDTSGADESHYFPKDKYSSAADEVLRIRFPLGHHLKDTMWPWDETKGQQNSSDLYTTRPNAQLAKFRQAPSSGLWPTEAASPQCADMIDYLGLASGRSPHGFAYDDTPFGAAPSLPLAMKKPMAPANLKVFLDPGASEVNRLEAARDLSPLDFERIGSLADVLKEKDTSAAVKIQALTLLTRAAPAEGLKQAVAAAKGTEATVAAAAANELVRMHNFASLSDVTRADVYKALQELAQSDLPQVQGIVLDFLASHADEQVSPLLKELLEDHLKSPLPLRRLVVLARQYPEHFPLVRPLLEKKQGELVMAALSTLEGDKETLNQRLEMVASKKIDPGVRRAAMRSVMTDTPGALAVLLQVATDVSEADGIRAEAAAGVRVTIQSHRRALGDEVAKAEATLSGLRLQPGTELSKTVELTLATIREGMK